jgi:hypothetical protein
MSSETTTPNLINLPPTLLTTDEKSKKTDIYKLHGELYYAYREAVGYRLLKAAYQPAEKRWYTWLLWIITIAMFSTPIALISLTSVTPWVVIAITLVWVLIYTILATSCINKGIQRELLSIGARGNGSKQPGRLVRTLLHHLWFSELVDKIAPSKEQISQCIEFADHADAPVSNTSYFRHPFVLLLCGVAFFMLNNKLSSWGAQFADNWMPLALVFYIVAMVLYVGWLFHSKHTDAANDNWRFKRCLKWYQLNQQTKGKNEEMLQNPVNDQSIVPTH